MISTLGVRTMVLGGVVAAVLVGGIGGAASARTTVTRGSSPTVRRVAKTWEVKASNAPANHFEPKDLTIQVGDTVKWVIEGGSHNVQFWKDSVPAAGVAMLQKATENDTLWTPRMPTAGQTFSIAFTDAPKGVYKFFCTPHLMRGMVGSLTVQ